MTEKRFSISSVWLRKRARPTSESEGKRECGGRDGESSSARSWKRETKSGENASLDRTNETKSVVERRIAKELSRARESEEARRRRNFSSHVCMHAHVRGSGRRRQNIGVLDREGEMEKESGEKREISVRA